MSFTPKKQLTLLGFTLILSGFSLASILNFTNPYTASWVIFCFFYLSLFLFSFACLTLLAFSLKRWLWPKIFLSDFGISVRHGLILSVFILLAVALQIGGLLFWWLELTLIIFVIFIEILIN